MTEIIFPAVLNDRPTRKSVVDIIRVKNVEGIAVKIARNIYIRCRLAEAQNWRCCYCGTKCVPEHHHSNSATIEHIHPRSLGGVDHHIDDAPYDNYAMACAKCNHKRGNRTVEDFIAGVYPDRDPNRKEQKRIAALARRMRKFRKRVVTFNDANWVRNGKQFTPEEWIASLDLPEKCEVELRGLVEYHD